MESTESRVVAVLDPVDPVGCICFPPEAKLPHAFLQDSVLPAGSASDEDILNALRGLLRAIAQHDLGGAKSATFQLECMVPSGGTLVEVDFRLDAEGKDLNFTFWDLAPHHDHGHALGKWSSHGHLELLAQGRSRKDQALAETLEREVIDYFRSHVALGECRVDVQSEDGASCRSVAGHLFVWQQELLPATSVSAVPV